jgi:hypothetical protein
VDAWTTPVISNLETRKTYRAILSEPALIIPQSAGSRSEDYLQDTISDIPKPALVSPVVTANQRKRPLEEPGEANNKEEDAEKMKKKNKKR